MASRLPQYTRAWITYIFFSVFSILFLTTPFFRGLFFHDDYYLFGSIFFALLVFTAVVFFSETKWLLDHNRLLFLLGWAIPAIYFISHFVSAAPYLSANETLQWVSYIGIFFSLLIWLRAYKISDGLWALIWITMSMIVVYVYFAHMGIVHYNDAVLDGRFSSVFQYPNTLASIVSAFLIAAFMRISSPASRTSLLMYSISVIPFFLVFLLAESRGGILVFAIGWIIGLFFMGWKNQILYICNTILGSLCSLLAYSLYRNWTDEGQFWQAALLLIVMSLIFAAAIYVIHRFVKLPFSTNQLKRRNLILPLSFLGLSIVGLASLGMNLFEKLAPLFPGGLQSRISRITLAENSVQTRFLFYKDSFQVWKEHWFLGTGGGGWQATFDRYQSLPYFSTQAHSFYMQTLVEVGLVGAIFVFGFFFYILIKSIMGYFRNDRASDMGSQRLQLAIVMVIVLMIHNAVDFNMSFGTYNLFLFTLLALIWNYADGNKKLNDVREHTAFSAQRGWLGNAAIIAVVLIGAIGFYKSAQYYVAQTYIAKTQAGGDTIEQLKGYTDRAIDLRPNHARFRELKIALLSTVAESEGGTNSSIWPEIGQEWLELLELEPWNVHHYIRYADYLYSSDRVQEAIDYVYQGLRQAPWSQPAYETHIQYSINHLIRLRVEGQGEEMGQPAEQLHNVLLQLEERLQSQEQNLPPGLRLSNRLQFSDESLSLIGQAYFLLGQYEKALSYFEEIELSNLSKDRQETVLLLNLISLERTGEQEKLETMLESEYAQSFGMTDELVKVLRDHPDWQPITR